jgi:putative Mg2+ transporter-C (MgtC) family protein
MELFNLDQNLVTFGYLMLALALGSTLGLERSFAGKTAGLRTFGLVSMGACLFIIIAQTIVPEVGNFNFDPLRIAASVVMGIGFLCGGVIVFKDSSLSGLTTAAGLWVAAGIGMAVGYGLIALSIFATLATLLVFTLFWYIENGLIKKTDIYNGSR